METSSKQQWIVCMCVSQQMVLCRIIPHVTSLEVNAQCLCVLSLTLTIVMCNAYTSQDVGIMHCTVYNIIQYTHV